MPLIPFRGNPGPGGERAEPGALQKLVSLLEREFLVVAAATNGQSVLECVKRHRPDVVVLDLEMPVLNGIETANGLRDMPSPPAVVICSGETDLDIVESARQSGAIAYVYKMNVAQDLVKAVKFAAQGQPFVSSPWRSPGIQRNDPELDPELLCIFK